MLAKLVFLVLAIVFCNLMIHCSNTAFIPLDNYLIACGSSQNISVEGRMFVTDSHQSYVLLKSESDSVVASSETTAPSPIYQSLRVFTKPSSYEFSIRRQGRHWVRLYFHPLPNSGHGLNSAPITVITEKFVLLNNFAFNNQKSLYLFKEYMINVTSDKLTINFLSSNNSVAFVNGIEVVSVPDDLIPSQAFVFSPSSLFNRLSERALETVYRLNMGGALITPHNDTLGRTWENDQKYLHGNGLVVNASVEPGTIKYDDGMTSVMAPNFVYATAEASNFNIKWVFSVDPTFVYFVRLHFCDIVSNAMNELLFNVYINSNVAIASLDLSSKTGHLAGPYYKDFISNSSTGSKTMSVSVGPDMLADITNAILNGLEIMKISNDARSLDGESSVDGLLATAHSKKSKMGIIIGLIAGALVAVGGLIALCCFCFTGCRSKASTHPHPLLQSPQHGDCLASKDLGRVFTFQEIMDSTNEFHESLILGVGGFGKVYKGMLEDGTLVAVRRGDPTSKQGFVEFHTELEMLSKLGHRHLVSLIGYCNEQSEMILVYEYMANGTLRSHLCGKDLPSLTWKQRLKICLGAARGLHYLHTGAAQSIIHRDVKTTNILLDENFVAKLADLGISKTIPTWDQTHVSTTLKGSFGYFDPEYFRSQQLTKKSDVYSFGVVLMEVFCGRSALNPALPTEQVSIAEWAMSWQKKGMLEHVMDPVLLGKINPASSLKKFGEIAEKCLAEKGVERPTMEAVSWNLEFLLQLEEISTLEDEESTNHVVELYPIDTNVSTC